MLEGLAGGISILTEGAELLAGNDVLQTEPLGAQTDPLAGANFADRVVIVLAQVLVEIHLGVGQILLRNDGEHTGEAIEL